MLCCMPLALQEPLTSRMPRLQSQPTMSVDRSCRVRCRVRSRFVPLCTWAMAAIVLVLLVLVPSQNSVVFALSNRKVALVTGANKGIGYHIARNILSHKVDGENEDSEHAFVCILGCRDETLGKKAAESLATETQNSSVDVVTIDLMDEATMEKAIFYIQDTYGRCDVLVNNAAVCYNDPTLYGKVKHTPFAEQAKITIATNFFGTLALTRKLLPLLEETGTNTGSKPRIINIASSAGRLSIIPSQEKRDAISSESLTLEELERYMTDFVRSAQEGIHATEGWPNTGYGVSKVGIISMTKILAREYSDRIMVNSVDPGFCATDQNNNQGVIPAERGAVTPYLLATIGETAETNEFTSKHWYQEQEIAW